MKFISKKIVSLALVIAASSLGACTNPYKGVPTGYVLRPGQALTTELIDYQDKSVKPRCKAYAKQTNPSPGRMAGAFAVNGLVGGIVGGALGVLGYGEVVGMAVSGKSAAGAGVNYGLAAAPMNALHGAVTANGTIHSGRKNCEVLDAHGTKLIPPSDAEEVKRTGQARTYDRYRQSAIPSSNPSQAPESVMTEEEESDIAPPQQ